MGARKRLCGSGDGKYSILHAQNCLHMRVEILGAFAIIFLRRRVRQMGRVCNCSGEVAAIHIDHRARRR